jgi:hypothetical protein
LYLCNLLVVLDLLSVRWVLNLPELLFQIFQYITNLTSRAFNILIKLTALFNGCDCGISCGK